MQIPAFETENSYVTEATLPETNSKFTPENWWKMNFLLGPGLVSGAFAVSFSEGTPPKN